MILWSGEILIFWRSVSCSIILRSTQEWRRIKSKKKNLFGLCLFQNNENSFIITSHAANDLLFTYGLCCYTWFVSLCLSVVIGWLHQFPGLVPILGAWYLNGNDCINNAKLRWFLIDNWETLPSVDRKIRFPNRISPTHHHKLRT